MRTDVRIALAAGDEEIEGCYPVMAELRPHVGRDEFVPLVKRLAEACGYRLAYLTDGGVKAVAGFRISEWLGGGRYLEVEDLVAAEGERSKGYGGELFDWLARHAERSGCDHMRLVSRVDRADAHRFYLKRRMEIVAYYFSLRLR